MGVFTFVCRSSDKEWTVKQMNDDLEESAASIYDLQRKCIQFALSIDSFGGVQSSFSYVTPSSAVFQVIIGGGGDDDFFGGGGAVAVALSEGGASVANAPPTEEKNVGFCFQGL